jgi:hypothetical protein
MTGSAGFTGEAGGFAGLDDRHGLADQAASTATKHLAALAEGIQSDPIVIEADLQIASPPLDTLHAANQDVDRVGLHGGEIGEG